MCKKLGFLLRCLFVKIKNGRRVSLPLRCRLGKRTNVIKSNGRILLGQGVATAANTHLSALCGGVMTIGERVTINRNCTFVCRKEITIGDHCAFGPNVCIYDHDHKFGARGIQEGYSLESVVIEDHCWIGAGCIILRGTHTVSYTHLTLPTKA